MHVGIYTKTLCGDLRKGLLITLTLLFVCPGVWGQGTGTGTSEDPRLVSNETDLQTALNAGGHIKMTGDIEATTNNGFTIGSNTTTVNVNLDLNGYTLSNNYYYGPQRTSVITIHSGSTVTIQDSNSSGNGNGNITGGISQNSVRGGGIHNYGTLTIQSGKISGNNAERAGGGGTYTGGGGAIYNESGATLTIEGGEIYNNRAHQVGGIYNAGTLHLNGGYIHDNGSNTTNNTTDGIHNTSGATLYISGAPRIVNNSNGNIYLPTGKTITINGLLNGNEGEIGIKMQTPGVFTQDLTTDAGSTYTNTDGWKYFKSDDGNYDPYFADSAPNEASLQRNWEVLGKRFMQGGTITLTKNYTASTNDVCLSVPSDKTLVLDMNGKTIDRNHTSSSVANGMVISNAGTLTITSTSSSIIKGGWNTTDGGGIYNTGTLTLEGTISITGNKTRTGNGGGIYNAGSLTIGGTIVITDNRKGENTFNTGNPNNLYLSAGHGPITIHNTLTAESNIGVITEMPGVFTSGLSSAPASTAVFTCNNDGIMEIIDHSGDAETRTYWSVLKSEMAAGGDINLTRSYSAHSSDSYLEVPSDKTVNLTLNGYSINRVLSEATDGGCIIKNNGTLTIAGSGYINGGYNNDNGGAIYNNGNLTLEGTSSTSHLVIWGGKISSSHNGAGIYNTSTSTLTMKGYLEIRDNYLFNSPTNYSPNNVYLPSSKTITIGAGGLSTSSTIYISHEDPHIEFTTGLNWPTGTNLPFKPDDGNKHISRTSTGEAIIGPFYTITKASATYGSITLSETKAVEGAEVSVTVSPNTGYVPYSLTRKPTSEGTPVTDITTYPIDTHTFTMPGEDTTVEAVFKQGGYCGSTGNENKMKYYLDESTLTFTTNGEDVAMNNTFSSETDVSWKNLNYNAVSLSDHVTSISPYAFFGSNISSITIPSSVATIGAMAFANCSNLATVTVSGGAHFTSDANVLYTNGKTELICYPAGLDVPSYTLPNTVTTVRDGAFAYNTNLTTINVAAGGSSFSATNGVLYNAGGTVLYCYPAKKEGDVYDVASTVTEIKPYAFHNNNLLKVVNFCEDAVPTGGEEMFGGTIHNDLRILVKNGLKVGNNASHYQGADYWKDYYTRIYEMNLANASVKLEYTTHKYEDTYVKPGVNSVKITVGGQEITLRKDIDYVTISDASYTNNNAVGTATVTVTGKNGYNGTSKATNFTITRELIISGADNRYTYYASEDLTLPSDITAWTYTAINWTTGVMTPTQINYIPANVPVILYRSSGSINNTYYLTAHAGGSHASPIQYYRGTATAKNIDELKTEINTELSETAEYIYVLRGENFVRATSGTLPAKHCYFYKPSGTAAPSVLTTTFSTTSGGSYKIETLNASNGTVTIKYDNSGTPTNVNVNETEIPAGKTVTLTITPNDGFYLSALQCEEVTTLGVAMAPARRADKTQEIHKININTNYEGHFAGDYTFSMPRNNVIVTATFVACTSITSANLHWDSGDGPQSKVYDGAAHTMVVKVGDTELTKDRHYTTTDSTLTNVGSINPTITGIGEYNGSISSTTLSITQQPLTITAQPQTITYGSSIQTGISYVNVSGLVTNDALTSITLTPSTPQVTTTGTITPSGATTTKGISNYAVTYNTGTLTIQAYNLSGIATVTFTQDYYNYDGSPHQPSIDNTDGSNMKVYYGNTRLTQGSDFTTSYTATNGVYTNGTGYTQPDIYTIDITFTGNYTGSKQVNYQIRPEITLNNNNGHRWRTYYNKTYNMEVTNDFEAFTVSSITTNSVILNGPKAVIKSATPMLLYRKTGTASGIYPALIKPSDARLADSYWTGASTYLKCHVDGGGTPINWILDSDGGITGGTTKIMILVDDKFAYSKSGTLAAGKCYLDVSPVSPSPAPSLFIGTNPTGIEEETIKDFDLNGVWYTLDGRQIQGIPGQKGIYIKNGKKIIIK